MIIYVAGPYSAPTEDEILTNTTRAIDAGIDLIELGHVPFIPHMNGCWDRRAKERGTEYSHAFWLDWCLVWLAKCDALLFLGPSPGADIELEFARTNGMPVYRGWNEVPI